MHVFSGITAIMFLRFVCITVVSSSEHMYLLTLSK